jgi:hypothetical protein
MSNNNMAIDCPVCSKRIEFGVTDTVMRSLFIWQSAKLPCGHMVARDRGAELKQEGAIIVIPVTPLT